MARPGSVGFISQSGALCTAILDWSLRVHVGFSAFVSIGSMLDVGWGDLIDYLGDDPYTKCIVIYMESIGDARSFLSAVARGGADQADHRDQGRADRGGGQGSRIAYRLVDRQRRSARRRVPPRRRPAGRLDLSKSSIWPRCWPSSPGPRGPRLAIVTNAGGPGVLATDALIENRRRACPALPATIDALETFLPAAWSHNNPIDILGDADAHAMPRRWRWRPRTPTSTDSWRSSLRRR